MTPLTFLFAAIAIAIAAWLWRQHRSRADKAKNAVHPWDPGQPGRAAIDAALARIYADNRERRWILEPDPGETVAPLEEVAAYLVLVPDAHWHFIGFGLSDTGCKSSDDSVRSGFGIELTLRVSAVDDEPPEWPVLLLRSLAAMVNADGVPLVRGSSFPLLPAQLAVVPPGTDAAAITHDAVLHMVPTSNGMVSFLQVLPLTRDEYALMGRWDASKMFAELRAAEPGHIWYPDRKSILAGPRAADIESQARIDGSSQEVDHCGGLTWDGSTVVLDAVSRHVAQRVLRYRVAYRRSGRMMSGDRTLDLEPGPLALVIDGDRATLRIPAERAAAVADALAAAGSDTTVEVDGVPLFRLGRMERLGAPFDG